VSTDTATDPFIDDVKETAALAVTEIEALRSELAALRKRDAHGKSIADQIASQDKVVEQAKKNLKREVEALDALNQAAAVFLAGTDPNQQTLDLGEGEDVGTFREAAPEYVPNADGAMEIPALDWTAVHLSALSALASTGKPARVRPVEMPDGLLPLRDVPALPRAGQPRPPDAQHVRHRRALVPVLRLADPRR
jgi:hypothetical protein